MTLTHTRKSFIERGLLCVIHYKSDSQDGKRGDREKKSWDGGKEIYFDKMQICKRYSSFFLGNGVLQETNDLYLLKKQEQQLHIFESLIKCVLFPALSLLI